MQQLYIILLSIFSLVLVSCGPQVQKTHAFAINTKTKQPCVIKPKRFNITKKTRPSQVLALAENATATMSDSWTKKTFQTNPAHDQKAAVYMEFFLSSVQEKSKSNKTMAYIPTITVFSQNIPQEQIDRAVPIVQKEIYKNLSKDFTFIPFSKLATNVTPSKPN